MSRPEMSGRRQYGETMREKRARWKAAGLCRDCGAPEDKPGSGRCARHRESRNRGNYRRRHVAVTVHLPGPLHHRIREDAESRGESVADWLLAAARESFEPEPEGEA